MGNWGIRRKAPNVQRLQRIVRLLFHTNLTTEILRDEDTRFQQSLYYEISSRTNFPEAVKGVGNWFARGGCLRFAVSTGSKEDARLAIISLVRRRMAGMRLKPKRMMRTMPYRELVDKSEGGLETGGGAITIGDTYRRSIGRTVFWYTRSSHCPSSGFQCCCRCRRCYGISTSHHILRCAPRHKIHQAGCPAAPASICSERSRFYLNRICDK